MGASLFISDLHLAAERPRILEQFHAFVDTTARGADALYVLGDLFDEWLGDDNSDDPLNADVALAFARLAASGTAVYFMHGNRDVLVGGDFAKRAGATLLPDPTLIDLYGTPTLLMHGDTLCTDDVKYLTWRAYAHDPGNQARFLGQTIAGRRAEMEALQARNRSEKADKSAEIMDVNADAVAEVLRTHGYPRLIHGHTHRPARHVHAVDGRRCERYVLADWYESGSYLRCDASGCVSVDL
ncbi:MAG TPA: UDP-2,3-diacylglucosamine diphosphatase [Burkholderiales bacterium]|nr:UDP-2,3-diacylglucosamine diphosphatase [Burkholderiales bacterium]